MSPAPTREELVAAARRAIETHGLAGATLERIAAEAGINRVTLHRRGVSKDDLVADLARRAEQQYREALWPALVAEGSGGERLRLALDGLCRVAEDNLELLSALGAGTGRLGGEVEAAFHEPGDEALTRAEWTGPLRRLLRDGLEDGSLRELDATEMATVLFNLVGWTYIHLRTGHRWSPERARAATVEVALRGVLTPGGS